MILSVAGDLSMQDQPMSPVQICGMLIATEMKMCLCQCAITSHLLLNEDDGGQMEDTRVGLDSIHSTVAKTAQTSK